VKYYLTLGVWVGIVELMEREGRCGHEQGSDETSISNEQVMYFG